MSKVKKISKPKLVEGIAISLKTAARHLDAAEVLINNDLLDDAVASIEFAIEEFGRAVYLRERLQKGFETIEAALERNHWLKYDRAFSLLPENIKTIWESTINPTVAHYFPKGFWHSIKETISPSTRLDAIFNHFDEATQTWHSGIRVNKEKLIEVVYALRKYTNDFKF